MIIGETKSSLDLFDASSKYSCSLDLDNVPSSDLLNATDLAVMSVSTGDREEAAAVAVADEYEEGNRESYGYANVTEVPLTDNYDNVYPAHLSRQNHPIYLHSFPLPRKICSNCGSISTPSWRRCPEGRNLLCNACGLYQKLHRRPRPLRIREDGSVQVIRNMNSNNNNSNNNNNNNKTKCDHCGAMESTNWNTNGRGQLLCAACSIPDDLIERIFPPLANPK